MSKISESMSGLVERVRYNRELRWWLRYLRRWAVVLLAVAVWSLAMVRVGQKKALEKYEIWMEDYRVERLEIDRAAAAADPYELQLNAEAELLAKVLYGIKDNSTDDLRTCAWCVFNRVDNPAYPDDLEAVIAQPQQWMRFDAENPVLEPLYQIARQELEAWHSDAHRPCSADFVYLNWSPSDVCLRDLWAEGSGTHYWRYSQ